MNMIVVSNQWNIIYKMNSHNGTDKSITAEGLIKGPRHMDYNKKNIMR
jgi:2-hydroxy-3-keto-5-methylthiopentenyl-1-phosphate phosphatase